jgi:hypothetical protein
MKEKINTVECTSTMLMSGVRFEVFVVIKIQVVNSFVCKFPLIAHGLILVNLVGCAYLRVIVCKIYKIALVCLIVPRKSDGALDCPVSE